MYANMRMLQTHRQLHTIVQRTFTALVTFLILIDAAIGICWLLACLTSGWSLRLQQTAGCWAAVNVLTNFAVCVFGSPGKFAIQIMQCNCSSCHPTSFTKTQHVIDTGLFADLHARLSAGCPHEYISFAHTDPDVQSDQYDSCTYCQQCSFPKPPQAHHCR